MHNDDSPAALCAVPGLAFRLDRSRTDAPTPRPVGDMLPTVPELLTEKQVCKLTNLSRAMVQRLRSDGGGPEYVKIGKSVRYPVNALSAWIDSRRVTA